EFARWRRRRPATAARPPRRGSRARRWERRGGRSCARTYFFSGFALPITPPAPLPPLSLTTSPLGRIVAVCLPPLITGVDFWSAMGCPPRLDDYHGGRRF